MIEASKTKSLALEKVRKFLEQSGFTVPKMQLSVRGRLEKWETMLAIKVPGREEVFVLAGGPQLGTLEKAVAVGKEVRVTGLAHPSHGDSPAGLTVEEFAVLEGKD